MSEVTYICSVCGRKVDLAVGSPVPLCCHKEMEPLPFCTAVPHAEMSRSGKEEEPCDDGTLGKSGKGK